MHITDPLADHLRISETHKKALVRLGIKSIYDLLYHFPVRYGDPADVHTTTHLETGTTATLYGTIPRLKTSKGFRTKIPMAEGRLEDAGGAIKLIWFHQPYIAKMVPLNTPVRVEGKVAERKGEKYISNPKIETLSSLPIGNPDGLFVESDGESRLYPIYPETKGLTSNWIFHAIQKLIKKGLLDTLVDPIPKEILKKYTLPDLRSALVWIHSPKKAEDAHTARKRFAFEEVFFIQLRKFQERTAWQKHTAYTIDPPKKTIDTIVSEFPFPLTNGQKRAIDSILEDFKKGYPMSRLLEGDVGSGKTAVAAATVYGVATTRPKGQTFGALQTAYMVPTEILAQQHFESFIEYFKGSGISIGLITGSGCRKFPSKVDPSGWTTISRAQLSKWVKSGEIPVLIGTHTLIQKNVEFKDLAYVIIDEQHRFGTMQRQRLREKDARIPHLLSMTATPIPRTLALTIYGDLDLSVLDELPPGRKIPETKIVKPEERKEMYARIREKLKEGRQVFVICPRIDEPDPSKELALNAKSATEEARRLQKEEFSEYRVGLVHGKMTPKDKERVMLEFANHHLDVLVATSVVEVGVNVPNATVIIIEGAERFGLAQLHQLRGRVMRSSHPPLCFILTETKSAKSLTRLKALVHARNGFELAEHDLANRGAGALYGKNQWGVSDVGMEAIKNIKMVEAARSEAEALIKSDPTLKVHPALQKIAAERKTIHFE